jgi:hypothetical protein
MGRLESSDNDDHDDAGEPLLTWKYVFHVPRQVCGKFVPANSTLMLSTFMGQVVTDPQLKLGTPSNEEFKRLEASWAGINAALLRDEFKPERWLEDTSKPSGLLTFRYDEAHY